MGYFKETVLSDTQLMSTLAAPDVTINIAAAYIHNTFGTALPAAMMVPTATLGYTSASWG